MAECGFLTLAFDPSFTGESGGEPRYMASPDINTEDFQAAVDFLSVQENVDPERIGIIGICGWGGMALNAAALDTRIKATVASHDVRHDPRQRQRLLRCGGLRRRAIREEAGAERAADRGLPQRRIRAGRRRGGPAAGRRAVLRQGLLRLLQDPARLPSPFPELQQRLERHRLHVLPEPADPAVRQRDPQRGAGDARREGPLLLLQPRRLRPPWSKTTRTRTTRSC